MLPTDKRICLEYVTKAEIPRDLFAVINTYLPYETTFERSRCDVEKLRILRKCGEDEVEYAESRDLTFISNVLKATFNHYSSHLPDDAELEKLSRDKQIIVLRDVDGIVSFIVYKINQNNVNFDQWISVKKDAQSSMKIINCFYNKLQSQNYRQVYVWVDVKNNAGVQKFHEFYGYRPDGLRDVFFINSLLKSTSK